MSRWPAVSVPGAEVDAFGSGIDEGMTEPESLFSSEVHIGFAHLEDFFIGWAILEETKTHVIVEFAVLFIEEDLDFDGFIQKIYGHLSLFYPSNNS